MQFQSLKKIHDGKFISRYDLKYLTRDGQEKIYEMISRDHDMHSLEDVNGIKTDAVVIMVTDESGERILLNHEFRLAAGCWVYNFPAGMIDEAETPKEAAIRELREETGLELFEIDDEIGTSYSAIGFSNEKNVCIVGKARGTFSPSDSSFEEIEAGWYTKIEVRELLKHEPFAARTQAWCYLWSRSES